MACILAIGLSVLTLSNQLRGGLPDGLAMCVSSGGASPMVCFDSQCQGGLFPNASKTVALTGHAQVSPFDSPRSSRA